MLDFDPDYSAGKAAFMPEAEPCARVWVAAAQLYAADALAAAQGKADKWRDRGQALRDLRGDYRTRPRRGAAPAQAETAAQARGRLTHSAGDSISHSTSP